MRSIYSYFTGDNFRFIIKNGFLLRAFLLVLVNGMSKKSLEIIRLSIHLKQIKRKIDQIKKSPLFVEHDVQKHWNKSSHDKVWVCWFQGKDNAPELVKKCIESISNLHDKEVIIITEKNYIQYVTFPDHIVEKWNKGIISHAHFSDLLRMELLYQHGGVWLDATVFLSSTELPNYLEHSWLFFFQPLKPGLDGHSINISSWAMSSVKSNPVLGLTRAYLFDYWSKKNSLEDYFLFHIVVTSILRLFPIYFDRIDKVCNSTPHILQLEMMGSYSETRYSQISSLTSVHKLTYKYDDADLTEDSFVSFLLNK